MPNRITASKPPSAVRSPQSSAPSREGSTPAATPGWFARDGRHSLEAPLERWSRLREPVLEPVKVRTAQPTAEARKMAKDVALTPRAAQDLIDELNGFGLADPMWPHFKSMGFHEHEAGELRQALRDSETHDRTSIQSAIGTEGLAKKLVAPVEQLSALVEALSAGQPSAQALAAVQGPWGEVLRRAPAEDLLRRATAALEEQVSRFITDSPVELVDVAPATARRGLLAVIASETQQLATGDAAARRKLKADGYTSIRYLRELTVLDPNAARVAGTRFAAAVHAAR